MKTQFTLLISLLISISSFAQTGFNYKAIIKDTNETILSNQDIDVRFTLLTLPGDSPVIASYQEIHSTTTDSNGLIILNIGEGTVIVGNLPENNWFPSIKLQTEIDVEQDGTFIDLGYTDFKKVPMAIHAVTADNVFSGDYNDLTNQPALASGLEQITEDGKIGWRLIGSPSQARADIGENAIDMSYSFTISSPLTNGATGARSFATGDITEASGDNSTAFGRRTVASGSTSTAMGIGTTAPSTGETSIGRYNTDYVPDSSVFWMSNDRLFVIGNGSLDFKSDALIVLKNGTITAPSLSNTEINSAGNKALITKEYADSNYLTESSNLVPIAYGIVESTGNVLSGTGNFTAFLSGNVFIIDVNGTESLSYNNTVCLITPISSAARTSSTIIADGNGDGDADLNVRVFNTSGTQVTTTFQFVIYKL